MALSVESEALSMVGSLVDASWSMPGACRSFRRNIHGLEMLVDWIWRRWVENCQ